MRQLKALTPAEFERAAHRLLHPTAGSRTQAAVDFGVDMTLLVEQLRLTPEERLKKLEAASTALRRVRGAARKRD